MAAACKFKPRNDLRGRFFRCELGGLVPAFDDAFEFDLAAGNLTSEIHLDRITVHLATDSERDIVAADFAVSDWGVAARASHGSGQFVAIDFEVEGCGLHGALAAWHLGSPFSAYVRRHCHRRKQRQRGK